MSHHASRTIKTVFYSLSSSPKAHAYEAHITVRTGHYLNAGRIRKGTASTFLAERMKTNSALLLTRQSLHFHLPADPDTPIMINDDRLWLGDRPVSWISLQTTVYWSGRTQLVVL